VDAFGSNDSAVVECVCCVVVAGGGEYDGKVLVCTCGGDAVVVDVSFSMDDWVVVAGVSIGSLHININS
tara:strand:+ start:129 stop:335 length:207 start_codon:yes stop_codon:yes gene_type:complete